MGGLKKRMRWAGRAAALGAIALGGLLVCASSPAAAEGRRIYLPVAMRRFTPTRGPANPLGMQISELRFRDLAMVSDVRRAGASWWRTFLFWDEVEPVHTTPPSYDWRLYDTLFRHAAQSGLSVIAEIQGNPTWAAEYPGGPPHEVDALAQFVAAAVERYDGDGVLDAPGSPRVNYWELYNEPDNTDAVLARQGRGWGYWGNSGAEYARMLKRVYPAVKVASRDARVVFGGLAYDAFTPEGPFSRDFLSTVLNAGAGPYFDVVSFHYYVLFAPRWAEFGPGILGKTEALRQALAAAGVPPKPMLASEAGTWSAGQPPYPPTTPEEQARYVPQLYAQSVAAGLFAAVWFTYDDVSGFDDPARGLVDSNLEAKPALSAYRVAADQFTGLVANNPARDTSAAGEVYWFHRGSEQVAVAWTTDGQQATLRVRAAAVERVHMYGTKILMRDESDGVVDGFVSVPYGTEPVYVRVVTSP